MKTQALTWAVIGSAALMAHCSPDSFTASISGTIELLEEGAPRIILEQEINDDLTQTHFLGNLQSGETVTLLGDVSLPAGDAYDIYEIQVDRPQLIRVDLALSTVPGAEDIDLDLSVLSGGVQACKPKNSGQFDFTICLDGVGSSEQQQFEAQAGSVVLAVSSAQGSADYQLDVALLTEPTEISKRVLSAMPSFMPIEPAPQAGKGELLIAFLPTVTDQSVALFLRAHQLELIERSACGLYRVCCAPSARPQVQAGIVSQDPRVRYAEPNMVRQGFRMPNDKAFNVQWHYQAINLPQAWDSTTGSDAVVVAVVDTGIVSTHPDLQERLLPGFDFIADAVRALDGDGRDADPEDPGDRAGGRFSTFHGTHVAGTIGAVTNNGRGVAGGTWQTRIMPIRVLGLGGIGTAFDISEGIRYAAGLPNVSGTVPEQPAAIINLSLGGPAGGAQARSEQEALEAALEAGALIVASAGNEGSALPAFPAALDGVISVGAIDIQFQRAPYSNYGSTIDLVAPGGFNGEDVNGDGFPDGVLSTAARQRGALIDVRYSFASGTSMAAPHVSAVAALIMAANPDLDAQEIRDILQATTVDLGASGTDSDFGYGLVDAAAAVREARSRAGITSSSLPVMNLSPTSLDFGNARTELRVRIFNAGSGFLNIQEVGVHQAGETDGGGWLRARLRGSSVANASADEVLVTVDRGGLDEGIYHGHVTLSAENVAAQVIDVVMVVGDVEPISKSVIVAAVNASSGDIVAEVEIDAADNFEFLISDMPAGSYVVIAGTDRDGDGEICELGDLCGAYPSFTEVAAIDLAVGAAVTDISFSLSRRLYRQAASAASVGR